MSFFFSVSAKDFLDVDFVLRAGCECSASLFPLISCLCFELFSLGTDEEFS